MKSTLVIVLAVGLAVAGCDSRPKESRTPNTANPATPPAGTAMPSATPSPSVSAAATATARDPAAFVDKAARAGAFEVEASRVAEGKASSGDVKSFAAKLVADHTRAAEELKAAAGGMNVPSEPSADQRAKIDALKGKSGADFDRAYAKDVGVTAHEEAVALFDDYAQNGTDANLKTYAEKTLPALREHLTTAKDVAAKVDAAK